LGCGGAARREPGRQDRRLYGGACPPAFRRSWRLSEDLAQVVPVLRCFERLTAATRLGWGRGCRVGLGRLGGEEVVDDLLALGLELLGRLGEVTAGVVGGDVEQGEVLAPVRLLGEAEGLRLLDDGVDPFGLGSLGRLLRLPVGQVLLELCRVLPAVKAGLHCGVVAAAVLVVAVGASSRP
jgi:hypothetical protein